MLLIVIILILLLLSYVGVVFYNNNKNIPPSLSEGYYILQDKIKHGHIFTYWAFLTSILGAVVVLELSEGQWFQFLGFFAVAALGFVGASPIFKNTGMQRNIHSYGAAISAAAIILWLILMGDFVLVAFVFALAWYWIKNKGNRIFWLEIATFLSLFIALLDKA